MPTMDPVSLRAALERQQAELAPIARLISAIATFPPRLQPDEWRGRAADSCDRLEHQLQRQLRSVDDAIEAACRDTRTALLELARQ